MMSFLVDRTRYVAAPLASTSCESSPSDEVELALACRHCGSTALTTDWKAGDVICTHCGVVAEEHVRDLTGEWRDFQDEDNSKGLASMQRCGMVATDERLFVGGLEPTTLSKQPFGGPLLNGRPKAVVSAPVRRAAKAESFTNSMMVKPTSMMHQLRLMHRKIEFILEKDEKDRIKDAELAKKIMAKRRLEKKFERECKTTDGHEEDNVLPASLLPSSTEYNELPHDNDDVAFARATDKWSLDHALLLLGTNHGLHSDLPPRLQRELEQRREELETRLTRTETESLQDVFLAYSIIHSACQSLNCASKVVQEAASLSCRYASKMNGFRVKGFSPCKFIPGISFSESDNENHCKKALKFHNKVCQMGALNAAVIYVTSMRLGQDRGLALIIQSVEDQCRLHIHLSPFRKDKVVTTKSCSRAMEQLQKCFPNDCGVSSAEVTAESGSETERAVKKKVPTVSAAPDVAKSMAVKEYPPSPAANLVPHLAQELSLPTEAMLIIKHLTTHLSREQLFNGTGSGYKPSVLCAAATLLICNAGSVMHRLAKQAISQAKCQSKEVPKNEEIKRERMGSLKRKHSNSTMFKEEKPCNLYDTLLPDPVISIACADQHSDEVTNTLQQWHEWLNHDDWKRDYSAISKASGVTSKHIFRFYKNILFAQRAVLLNVSNKAARSDSASHLSSLARLSDIAAAAPLMRVEKPLDS
jgi:transcription initiation factor TFIIIB Brf1 subunit/transcription initiation factor TFIIB